uniref:AAA+ ATPase domain-containing protein n=1 Tax=Meloidogyne incognita TaxID=6306 RepID=A0A914NGT3_MELIC
MCSVNIVVIVFVIRSSFTRAFQKGSSKKNKQTQQQINEEEKQQKINEENGKKNEQPFYVNSLKKELENKELALTDVQLDALDKAKEIDILRETVNKLQHENRMLKYNFSLLERRVRSESRASSHISLNTNLCSGGPPDCGGGELDVDALEEAANQLLEVPEHSNLPLYDIVASSPSSGDFSVNTTTTGSSLEARSNKSQRTSIGSNISKSNHQQQQFIKVVLCVDMSGRLNIDSSSNSSALPPPSSSCSLTSISRASSGSSSTLSSLGSALSGCGNKRRELSIGHLNLPLAEGINWNDLDQQLGLLLEEYLHRIDPDLSLGVDSYSSIIGYQIIPKNSLGLPNEWLIRKRNSVDEYLNIKNNETEELTPKLTPEEVLLPGTLIRLRLRGVAQHSVDSLVLESLFPRNLLEQLLDQLEKYRRLILFGTAGIGKSNLARLIAKYYLMKFNIELNNKSLIEIHFPTENNNLIENESKIQQAKEQLLTSLNSQQNNLFSTFILLDNLPLKYLNGIVFDVFQSFDLKNKSSNNKPFIICTLNRTNLTEQLIIQKLQIHHNFHLCPLNQKMEAVNGYLGRYLRRRMAEQTLSSLSTSLPSSSLSLTSLDSLIDFLNRSLYLINEFIERTANGGSNVTLGPRILLQCPLDGDQAKEWFIRLWNDKLVPYLRKAVIEGNNPKSDLIDLTEQIKSIWPWQNFSEELKTN